MAAQLSNSTPQTSVTISNGSYDAKNSHIGGCKTSNTGLMNGLAQSPVSSSAGSTDFTTPGPLSASGNSLDLEAGGDATLKDYTKVATRRGRSDTAPPLDPQSKQLSSLIQRCVKELTREDPEGASIGKIFWYLKETGAPDELINNDGLNQAIEREIAYVKLKRLDSGNYALAKKRGRPFGTGFLTRRRSSEFITAPNDQSPGESSTSGASLASKRRKSTKHLMDGFVSPMSINSQVDPHPAPNSTSQRVAPNPSDVPICDFCLQSASRNKRGEYEALLMCKDCPARAHPTCMTYNPVLARRAAMSAWQCIDCKTCCLCLEAGDPDGLLFCDACDKGYHMICHDPQLSEKPGNKWACGACLRDGVNLDDVISESRQSSENVSADTKPPQVNGKVSDRLPTSVASWTPRHVRRYILECGFTSEAERFLAEEIDGSSLLLLQRQDVLSSLSFKLGPALKIYERIRALQSGSRYPPQN